MTRKPGIQQRKFDEFVDLLFSRWNSKYADRDKLAEEVLKDRNYPDRMALWLTLAKCKEWRLIK